MSLFCCVLYSHHKLFRKDGRALVFILDWIWIELMQIYIFNSAARNKHRKTFGLKTSVFFTFNWKHFQLAPIRGALGEHASHRIFLLTLKISKIHFALSEHTGKKGVSSDTTSTNIHNSRNDKLSRCWKPSVDLHFCIERFTVLHRSVLYVFNIN